MILLLNKKEVAPVQLQIKPSPLADLLILLDDRASFTLACTKGEIKFIQDFLDSDHDINNLDGIHKNRETLVMFLKELCHNSIGKINIITDTLRRRRDNMEIDHVFERNYLKKFTLGLKFKKAARVYHIQMVQKQLLEEQLMVIDRALDHIRKDPHKKIFVQDIIQEIIKEQEDMWRNAPKIEQKYVGRK